MKTRYLLMMLLLLLFASSPTDTFAQRKTDPLDRGLVAVPGSGGGIYLSWRVQADEYYGVKYNVYRGGSLIAENLETSNFRDTSGNTSSTYTVAPVRFGTIGTQCAAVTPWAKQYLEIPMANVQSSNGTTVWTREKGALMDQGDYVINDVSLGDVDGDGKIDFIVKRKNQWDQNQLFPTDNWQFFAHIECYASSINYGRLWWIDCGRNICYGADEQWDAVAFDWNQDGKAEVLYRGGAGTVLHHSDGTTETIGSTSENIRGGISHTANMTFSNAGEEWLMYIDGSTGKKFDAIEYPLPRGNASDWGDGYGHRSSKYFMGAPYLDGNNPYIFLGRGIYTKIDACTYKVNSSNKLEKVGETWHSYTNKGWYGQGNHNYNIADVDEDGADEIVYGSMVLDFHTSDRSLHGMSSTSLGHGDAIHTGDLDPYRKGLETFACNEDNPGNNYRNAATCEIYSRTTAGGDDGRAMAGNFTNDYPGGIGASTSSGIIPLSKRQANPYSPTYIDGWANDWNANTPNPIALNFRIYWDGDLLSETINGPGSNEGYLFVDKLGSRIYDTGHGNYETACINSTKKNPCATGDILGDWREELIMRSSDNKTLRVYTTNTETTHRMQSLWYDHQYRQAMVWQTEGYNQPPHPSFFVGEMEGFTAAPPAFTKTGREVPYSNEIRGSLIGGKDVLVATTGDGNEQTVTLVENAQPSTIYLYSRTTIEGGDQVAYKETKHTFDRIRMTGAALTGGTNICKQGDAAAHLAYADHTTNGKTDVWAGALICDGTLRNSDIWANRFTELYFGNNLTDPVSLYKSITMEYGSALYISNQDVATPYTTSSEAGHMSVGNLSIHEGSRVVFDIKGNANADGDKLDITGNLAIRKQTDAAWVNYGPEHLAPIFQFRASKPLASGKYLLGAFAGAEPGNLNDIELECTTEDATASKKLKVENGNLYLVIGGNSAQAGTGDFYLMNVASGTYISLGSSYGSHLTVDGQGKVVTISGTADNYLLHVEGIANNKYVDANGWSDRLSGGDGYTTFTLEPTTADGYDYAYKLKANTTGKYLKWRNNVTFTDPNIRYQNEVISAENNNSDEYKWVLVGPSTRTNTSGASASSPADMTYKIANPDMEADVYNNTGDPKGHAITSWSGDFVDNYSAQTSFTGHFAEKWVASSGALSNVNATQNLTALPNGAYRISVDAKALRQGQAEEGATTGTYVFANDQKTEIHDIDNYSVYVYVNDGNLSLGVKTESTTANWVSFDNVRLNYYGDITIAELLFPEENTEYLAAVAAADNFASKLNGDAQTEFQTAINALKVNVNSNDITAEALLDAAEKIRNAMKNLTVDMTSAIKNPHIDVANNVATNWTGEKHANGQQYSSEFNNTYLDAGWGITANMYQNIGMLPTGKYMLKVATRATQGSNSSIYVKNGDTQIASSDVNHNADQGGLGYGWGWTYVPFEVTDNGAITIGFNVNNGVAGDRNWAGADDFSLTYYGDEYPMHDVVVNAVDGSGNIIRTIKSGEMQIGTYVSFPFAIEEQGVWYTINQPAQYSEQILSSGTITRTYTLNDKMVAFVEGESGVKTSTNLNASGGAIGYVAGQNFSNRGIVINDLSSGRYQFVAVINANAYRGVNLRDAGSTDINTNTIVAFVDQTGIQSQNFILAENKTLVVNGKNSETVGRSNQSADFDYAYILRLGDNYMDTYADCLEKVRQSLDDAGRDALGNTNPLNINSTEADLNDALAALATNYLNVAKNNQDNYLTRLVAEATTSHPIGSKMFDYKATEAATSALNTAIAATNAVKGNNSATADQVMTQISAMRLANEEYIATLKYNGPEPENRYNVLLNGTPLTRLEQDGMWFPTFKKTNIDVNYIQAFMLEEDPVRPLSYRLSFTNAAGQKQYLGNNGDDLYGVAITSDPSQAFTFTVERSATYASDDIIYLRNPKLGNNYLNVVNDENKALRTGFVGDGKPNFTIQLAAKASPTLAINPKLRWGTFIAPFDVPVPNDVEAYTVEGLNGTQLALNEITGTIPAHTPVILKMKDEVQSISVDVAPNYGSASHDDYIIGKLVGRYTTENLPVSDEDASYYILQKQSGRVGFYKQTTSGQPAAPYRCFLKVSAVDGNTPIGAQQSLAYYFPEGEVTSIEDIDFDSLPVIEEIHDAFGKRLNSLSKGVNIVKFRGGEIKKITIK